MVRITNQTEEEKNQETRAQKLLEIARKTLPSYNTPNRISGDSAVICIFRNGEVIKHNETLSVSLRQNRIYVPSSSLFLDAMELARAYESAGESEFEVKRDYPLTSGNLKEVCE